MSKLPNAPLQEVIFELKWKITTKEQLNDFQFLVGDLYSSLKNKYPFRESLSQTALDYLLYKPSYRYRTAEKEYPLIQIGPNIITLNTSDSKYFWNDFYTWIEELLEAFLKSMESGTVDTYYPSLIYLDFFKIDFKNSNVLDFINENLSLSVNQSFLETDEFPNHANLSLQYETELGSLNINLAKGKQNQEDGLILHTIIKGHEKKPEASEMLKWLDNSHKLCSELFKKLTKGKLYESFK